MSNGRICQACGVEEAFSFVTLRVDEMRPTGCSTRIVQFWLGEKCRQMFQAVTSRDGAEAERMARRLTVEPEFFTRRREFQKNLGNFAK